jgi:hypothetical protein
MALLSEILANNWETKIRLEAGLQKQIWNMLFAWLFMKYDTKGLEAAALSFCYFY